MRQQQRHALGHVDPVKPHVGESRAPGLGTTRLVPCPGEMDLYHSVPSSMARWGLA